MAELDYTEQLTAAVANILKEYDLPKFKKYWEFSREFIEESPVRGFYVRGEPGYGNLAILTDNLLADVEGEDNGTREGFAVKRLTTIDGVRIHSSSHPNLPDSVGALLIVLAELAGTEGLGFHWIAKTESEKENLIQFGKAIVKAINNSGSSLRG